MVSRKKTVAEAFEIIGIKCARIDKYSEKAFIAYNFNKILQYTVYINCD